MSDAILSIDVGTQSIRAALIDLKGVIQAMVRTPIKPYFSEKPGWAEQHAEYYWEMLCGACQELLHGTVERKHGIHGVALTTQRTTMINVDKDGKPLRPAITWLDQRKADPRKIIPLVTRPFLKAAFLLDFFEGVVQDCESNWIQQRQPEIWERTYKYLFLSGYLTYKLTGEFADSAANISGYVPFDVKTAQWAKRFDIKWKLFPTEREKLPDLIKPTELLGHVTRKASEETGIPEGLPLIAAANDKACEILGAGCVSPDSVCMSFGTTATVDTPNKKYVETRFLWPPRPAAIPGEYYTEVAVMRGFWMVRWFKEEFGLQETLRAREEGVSPEKLFDELIRDVPPGSMGLVLQPHWTPSPEIAPYAKGSVIGFGEAHTRAHLYRAIIEGLVFALNEGAQFLAKRNKTPITRLRISGGGSQSDAAMQIAADVFGIPAERPHTYEASALGAAIDAAVGLKLHSDFPLAVKEMTRVAQVFDPIRENHLIYKDLYDKVYSRIYSRLLPLFKKIQTITGYPP